MDTVVIYEATDELMANSVRDLLLQSGIGAVLRQRHLPGYGIRDPLKFGVWGEVLVYAQDREKAEELIAGFLGTLGMLEEADLAQQAMAAEPGDL